jgi:hypothetical protein
MTDVAAANPARRWPRRSRASRDSATKPDGTVVEFEAAVRIDTPREADYHRNGGILQYLLRTMLQSEFLDVDRAVFDQVAHTGAAKPLAERLDGIAGHGGLGAGAHGCRPG